MKQIFYVIFCCIICLGLKAQPLPDSVRAIFNTAKTDVEKGRVLITWFDMNTDQYTLFNDLVALKKYFVEKKEPVIVDYVSVGMCRQMSRGSEYAEAINELFQLLPRFEKRNDSYGEMVCNRHFSYAYYAAADSNKALYYDRVTTWQSVALGTKYDIAVAYNNLAADMAEYGYFDSAYYYATNAVRVANEINHPILICKTLSTMAEGYLARKQYDSAAYYTRKSMPIAKIYSLLDYVYCLNDLAQLYQETNQNDSAIHYATIGAGVANQIKLMSQVLRSYEYLYKSYNETKLLDSAYKYLQLTIDTKDVIYSAEKKKQVELITIREQNRQREIEQQKLELSNKIKIYGLLAGLVIAGFIGFMLYRNSHKEKKAKALLQKKNDTIEQTLSELKSTQAQLIQSEKMASLGELTAGIAHEIQNPLNFVNNFSEVSTELVDEMNEEMAKGNLEEAKEIASDLKQNLEKINHHGKRAGDIIKGMLQHSRSSSGTKEPTDINKLADEYLRLAYHGLRAKDKTFNATLKTDYDESIGNINIIPQDIGRVILNLITNAFYVVNEKKKASASSAGQAAYEPTVSVGTKKNADKVLISVKDNGNGIPQKVLDKIFQPFFTTKPTGQGTGLGLSLSYDIVKAHGGELKVATKEGEGTTFIVLLPA